MPYLKSPAETAAAIGVKTGGALPVGNDPMFAAMLDSCTATIERLLGTSLVRAGHIDKFKVRSRFPGNTVTFRLGAGFVVPESVVVTAPSGKVLNSDEYFLRSDLGSISIDDCRDGVWTFQYNAGFTHDSNTPPVFVGTPDWLRALVDAAATYWMRNARVEVRAAEGVSYHALQSGVARYLAGAIYGRYDRPRSPALFADEEKVVAVFNGA